MTNLKISVERNAAVFTLPWIIARDAGFFADEDLEIDLIPTGSYQLTVDTPVTDHKLVSALEGQKAYTSGEVGVFQA